MCVMMCSGAVARGNKARAGRGRSVGCVLVFLYFCIGLCITTSFCLIVVLVMVMFLWLLDGQL